RDKLVTGVQTCALPISPSWFRLLILPEVWGLVVAKFLSDSAWYFYLFWLPKYLYDIRGFDVKSVGYFGWIPYAASGVGCLVGGRSEEHTSELQSLAYLV